MIVKKNAFNVENIQLSNWIKIDSRLIIVNKVVGVTNEENIQESIHKPDAHDEQNNHK